MACSNEEEYVELKVVFSDSVKREFSNSHGTELFEKPADALAYVLETRLPQLGLPVQICDYTEEDGKPFELSFATTADAFRQAGRQGQGATSHIRDAVNLILEGIMVDKVPFPEAANVSLL